MAIIHHPLPDKPPSDKAYGDAKDVKCNAPMKVEGPAYRKK